MFISFSFDLTGRSRPEATLVGSFITKASFSIKPDHLVANDWLNLEQKTLTWWQKVLSFF
jgi:hypothetical protein